MPETEEKTLDQEQEEMEQALLEEARQMLAQAEESERATVSQEPVEIAAPPVEVELPPPVAEPEPPPPPVVEPALAPVEVAETKTKTPTKFKVGDRVFVYDDNGDLDDRLSQTIRTIYKFHGQDMYELSDGSSQVDISLKPVEELGEADKLRKEMGIPVAELPKVEEEKPAQAQREPAKSLDEAAKAERLTVRLDELKRILVSEIGKKVAVNKFDIAIGGRGLIIDADLDAGFLGGKIKIKGEIANVGDGISAKISSIDARSIARTQIENNLSRLSDAVKGFVEKQEGKKVSKINVSDAGLEVEFEPVVSGVAKVSPEDELRKIMGLSPVESTTSIPKTDLDKARERYVKAQKTFTEYNRVLKMDISGKSKKKVEEEAKKAKVEYEKLRAEYVDGSLNKFFEEKNKVYESSLEQYYKGKNFISNGITKFREGYTALGQYNLKLGLEKVGLGVVVEKVEKKKGKLGGLGRFAMKTINARTAISLGLLGVAGIAGVQSAVGIGAIVTRRYMAGAGAGFSAYDLTRIGLEKFVDKMEYRSQRKSPENLYSLGTALARMESKAILSGKNLAALQKDPAYIELLNKYKHEVNAGMDPDQIKDQLERLASFEDLRLSKLIREKKIDGRLIESAARAAGGGAALFVGSGALAEAFGRKTQLHEATHPTSGGASPAETPPAAGPPVDHEPPPVEQPAPVVERPAVPPTSEVLEKGAKVLHNGQETGATYDVSGDEVIVHAGKRGVEGTLLDMEEAQPKKFKSVVEWLDKQPKIHSDAAGGNTPDKLIHRFVLDYAHDKQMDPSQLDKILSGDIKIGADGHLKMGDIDYTDHAAASQSISEAAPTESSLPLRANILEHSDLAQPPKVEMPLTKSTQEFHLEPTAQAAQENAVEMMHSGGAMQHQEILSLATRESLAEALHEYLGPGNYELFLKSQLSLNAEGVNEIQNQSVGEFMQSFEVGAVDFKGRFGHFEEILKQIDSAQHFTDADRRNFQVKQIVVALAEAWAKNK